MTDEKKQKNFVIRCGAAEAYLTKIEKRKNQPDVYIYDTKEKKKAKKFTEEEALAIAEKQQAVAIKLNK